MFSKISNMLGNAWDFGSSLIKPLKNHVSNGWDMLKNGASKVGQFVNNNHESIGSILSGVGNILGNMPNSPLKQKLEGFGNTVTNAGNMFSNGVRPQNTPRQQFSNNLNSRIGQQQQPQRQIQQQLQQQQQSNTPPIRQPTAQKGPFTLRSTKVNPMGVPKKSII